MTSTQINAYAVHAAEGFIASMAHYGNEYAHAGSGQVTSPVHFENRLRKVMNHRRDSLPAGDWRGARWLAYAEQIVSAA